MQVVIQIPQYITSRQTTNENSQSPDRGADRQTDRQTYKQGGVYSNLSESVFPPVRFAPSMLKQQLLKGSGSGFCTVISAASFRFILGSPRICGLSGFFDKAKLTWNHHIIIIRVTAFRSFEGVSKLFFEGDSKIFMKTAQLTWGHSKQYQNTFWWRCAVAGEID